MRSAPPSRGEGEHLLPGRASIAHRLIADWHADTP